MTTPEPGVPSLIINLARGDLDEASAAKLREKLREAMRGPVTVLPHMHEHDDGCVLERAATIIESRAKRRTILVRAWCKTMRKLAARIREDAAK